MMMRYLEEKTIEQILAVLKEFRRNYTTNVSLDRSYRTAIKKVADLYDVRYQTIGDACRRRLSLADIKDFRTLLADWTNGNALKLINVLKGHTDSTYHEMILKFFQEHAFKPTNVSKVSTPDKVEREAEIISFRLTKEAARKMRALAELEGVSTGDWIAKMLNEVINQKLKKWAKSFVE